MGDAKRVIYIALNDGSVRRLDPPDDHEDSRILQIAKDMIRNGVLIPTKTSVECYPAHRILKVDVTNVDLAAAGVEVVG